MVVAVGAANVIFRAYNIEQVRLRFERKRGQARTLIFLQGRKVNLISKKKKRIPSNKNTYVWVACLALNIVNNLDNDKKLMAHIAAGGIYHLGAGRELGQ